MTTTNDKLSQLMTTTPEEDQQYLTEVIDEIKVKRSRGRPRIYTLEEAKERIRAYDRRRYHADPEQKKNISKELLL